MLKLLRQLHWSIYVLSLASGVIMAGFVMLLPILPRYADQLGFNEYVIGMLVAAFFIGRVFFQFPLGVVSDRVGRRLVMSASLFLFTITTTAYALTTEPVMMVSLRFLQGVASAGFVVGFQSYVNDRTPSELRGLAHGVNSSAINIGIIVGPLLGGILSEAYSITTPFWIGGALGATCFIASLTVRDIGTRKQRGGWGALAPNLGRIRRLLVSVLTVPALSLSVVHFLQMMSLTIFLTAAPLITGELLSWSATEIALALGASGAAAAMVSLFAGRLSDRRGARVWVMAGGLALMAVEALLIYLHPNAVITIAGFIIGGIGAPAYFNSFFSLIGDVTTIEERGAVSGFIGSFAEWGSIIGSSLLTPLLWVNISVDAPMALNLFILILTTFLVLALRRPLQQSLYQAAR